jgi:hypothetical protein
MGVDSKSFDCPDVALYESEGSLSQYLRVFSLHLGDQDI